MKKKIRFNTISIGSEPEKPDIKELTEFVRTQRGSETDLIRFYLIRSVTAQKEAGIGTVCGGGRYYLPRIADLVDADPGRHGEWMEDPRRDASLMLQIAGPVRMALPAPHLIPGSPSGDDDRYADFCDRFAGLLREMRDAGTHGHILHAAEGIPLEAERLASRRTRFIAPDGNQAVQEQLLEFQETIILTRTRLPLLPALADQYTIREVTIIDPAPPDYASVMQILDPDQIVAGGYGTGSEREYWAGLAGMAEVPVQAG